MLRKIVHYFSFLVFAGIFYIMSSSAFSTSQFRVAVTASAIGLTVLSFTAKYIDDRREGKTEGKDE